MARINAVGTGFESDDLDAIVSRWTWLDTSSKYAAKSICCSSWRTNVSSLS
jgi:hypothetical protein